MCGGKVQGLVFAEMKSERTFRIDARHTCRALHFLDCPGMAMHKIYLHVRLKSCNRVTSYYFSLTKFIDQSLEKL